MHAGNYQVLNSASNGAFNAGHIMYVGRCTDYVVQLAINPVSGEIAVRTKLDRTGYDWRSWRAI